MGVKMLKLILKYLKKERKNKKIIKNWSSILKRENEKFLSFEVNKIIEIIKNTKVQNDIDLKYNFYKMLLKEIKKLK